MAIIKQPNSNLVAVANNMQKKIDALKPLLPEGVTIQPYYNQANFVGDSVKSVTDSLWLGLGLANYCCNHLSAVFKSKCNYSYHHTRYVVTNIDCYVRGWIYFKYL